MSNTELISLEQLKQAVQIREQIDSLNDQLNEVLGGGGNGAQKLRWSKMSAGKAQTPAKGKRVMSAAARAKIAAVARARWKKAKAAGKTRL